MPAAPLLNRLTSFDPTASGPPSLTLPLTLQITLAITTKAPKDRKLSTVSKFGFLLTDGTWNLGLVSKSRFLLTADPWCERIKGKPVF